MKIICYIFFCLLLFSCNNSEEKKTNTSSSNEDVSTTSSKKEATTKDGALKQHGDYSTLFEKKPGTCDFITTEGIAKAINISPDLISEDKSNCTYTLTEANGNKTRFRFRVEPWSNKTVLKQIAFAKKDAKNFGENSKLSQYRISETGDSYLSMHQNRMVRILNETNENTVILFYTTELSSKEKSMKEITNLKDNAREQSYAIVNYVLNTHKK